MFNQIKQFRQDLHQIPELELNCPKTKEYIVNVLKELDCTLYYPIQSSVVAFFDANKKTSIAFRSDMDALPVLENTNCTFTSKQIGISHACGHDGHMAMLLGFALKVNQYYKTLDHNIVLIFQPGEENPGGAKLICETGILETLKVKTVFGTHLWPVLPSGVVATIPGAMMARSSEVNIDIYGKSSHAAKYKEGIDALEIAANYIIDVYNMEKQIDSTISRLLRFGKLESGIIRNVVSDHSRLEATLRSTDEDTYWYMRSQLEEISKKYSQAKFNIDINEGYPVTFNDKKLVEKITQAHSDIQILETSEMISEDFSWYQQYVPGVFFFLGTGTNIPLHNDKFNFDERILLKGIENYIQLSKMNF